MTSYNPRTQQPVRRDLTDPRSSGAPASGRTSLLNDKRSTRTPRGGS